ncbi:MAG: FHA domain-containing protein, partial [Burkholderiaceae bacterium]|nr:FHA domain-containing protein [Burkholderiaceae bacterium]
GSGFVVDPARRHVVSSWQAVTACGHDRAGGRQVGVIEAEGADVSVQLAERLPDRTYQDASGRPVNLVQALCRDKQLACNADLPRGPDDKPLADAVRRHQLDNLLAYAPDLAVLRLPQPLRTMPLALALNQQLDDQMRLVVRSFGPLPVGTTAADAAARLHLVAPQSLAALYTGPQQISYLPPGNQPGEEIHAKLHRLAAQPLPAQTGAPVMRGAGVVGVLTAMLDPVRPAAAAADPAAAGPAYAVPVTVLSVFLDLLTVPYVTAALELPLPVAVADPGPAPAPVADSAARAGWAEPQRLMLLGAGLLAVLAAAAFVLLARRRPAPVPAAALPPQQPTQRNNTRVNTRINPTVLHAVAMPTEAVEPPAAPVEAVLTSPRQLAPPPPGVHLHCSAGPLASAVFSLPMPNGGTTLFVGRDPQSCQVVFPGSMDQVSGVHACFVWDPPLRALSLRDLSSSGTWVNGTRITKGRTLALSAGDQVDLGGPEINRFTIDIPAADGLAATEFPR